MNTANTSSPALTSGTKIVITKGCEARQIAKGTRAIIHAVEHLGAQYSHMVKVTIALPGGRNVAFYARSASRLEAATISMNDGMPEHRITLRRA